MSKPRVGLEPWVYDPKYLLLHAIVGSLPPDQKHVYGLHFKGKNCREIAENMSISIELAESLLKEAERRVAEMRAVTSRELVKGYIKFGADGKASLVLDEDAGVIDFMHLFLVTFAQNASLDRPPQSSAELLGKWLGITNRKWGPWHFDRFVSAYERFVWDGNDIAPAFKFYNEELRKVFPVIQETRLDIQIPTEVRGWFRVF